MLSCLCQPCPLPSTSAQGSLSAKAPTGDALPAILLLCNLCYPRPFTMKVSALSDENPNSDEVVPIPVQIFLWRQTTPFVRPRLGKVHDAACMFCQRAPGHHELKEACKSFEKVLVQNLRFGLSISLTEAIEAIPRWRLIQAALPHVMHALAALLHNRVKDNMQSLGNVETKLLYTMHWIILDASDECADADYENGIVYSNPFHYLFSVPALTLFVFLFAPISHHLKESDFTNNYRLENGLKIWQGMWEYRHPDAPCFTTMVKPKPRPLGGKYTKKPQATTDVFLGRKFSKEEAGSPPSQNVSMSQSEVTSKQASTEEEPWPVSSPKETIFPETIPEESSSTEEEHVFIYRLPNEQNREGPAKEAYTVYAADPSLFQLRKAEAGKQTPPGIKALPQISKMSSSDKESLSDSGGGPAKGTPTSAEKSPPTAKQIHVSAATFLDVATLRCLFTSTWQEEGVYWALHYLYNRLRDICDELSKQTAPRKRSNSLPIPKIEVSIYQSPEMKERDSLKNFIEVPEPKDISPITEIPFPPSPTKADDEHVMIRRASEKVKRKMKMADLKAFVETKLLSKSEKALEKIGHDDHKFSFHTAVRMISEYHRSLDHTDDRPNSALCSNYPPLTPRGLGAAEMGDFLQCNLIKGKSMPSLSCLIDELNNGNGYIGEMKTERAHGPSNVIPPYVQKKKNPIITVTEHTPTPSPDYLSKTGPGSMESQMDSVSMQGSAHIPTPERKPSLTRSQTDSNITYVVEEVQEAPASAHYITRDGDINLQVVLKAVYSVSTMDSFYITLRVMEVMLNMVDTLMEIGVHKNWDPEGDTLPREHVDPLGEFSKEKDSKERDSGIPCAQSQESTNVDGGDSAREKLKEEENTDCPYYMIMHIVLRLLRQLGCSHGCTSALRGPQAECLRVQARNSLRALRTANIPKFTQRLREMTKFAPIREVLDNLHATIGFCAEPSSMVSPMTNIPKFTKRLREMTKFAPIREVLDNLHATIGFCAEPSSMVSPMNAQKRKPDRSPEISQLQQGYATYFGQGNNQGPNANKAIETFVIESVFRVLVTRFALLHKELKMLDNSGNNQGPNENKAIDTFVIESVFRVLVTRFALLHKELKVLDNSGSNENKAIETFVIESVFRVLVTRFALLHKELKMLDNSAGNNQGPNANKAIETFVIESVFRVLVTRFALLHKELKMLDNSGNNQGPNANKAIETFVIESVFRVLVTRFALLHKELKMLDNSALYSEVRLLLSYVREAHGSEFRAVAFSALLDTAERPDSQLKESNMQTTRVIRHIPRNTDDERGSDTGADSGCMTDEKTPHNKKFIFKKRSTSSTGAHSLLDTEGGDESASQSPLSVRTRRYQLTPRQSERTIPSVDITPHHKSHVHAKSIQSKFHISGIVNWFRQRPASQTQSLLRNGGGSGESLPISGSMVSLARPHHAAPAHTSRPVHVKRRVGHTLNRARKRVEDRLNRFGLRKMGKKRDGSIEDERVGGYMSRRGSAEGGSGGGESEVVVLKRRRLIQAAPLYAGLARFNLIIDATQPGGTPDALFMAALLDLPHTVVVARAAMLLECAHLVHNCNKGQWPYWLKSNVVKNSTSISPQLKRQRLAAKLFYQWAEAIGNRLEEMLVEDKKHIENVTNLVTDPDGQRELLQQDEEEDFLDEASIRLPGKPIGAECPRALRMVACVLLFEITSFLRETFQNIPKTCNVSLKERGPWDRVYREANRRWSMALSSMGHSQASAQSLQSIAGVETERKISFVLHEPENVSGGSNVTTSQPKPEPAIFHPSGQIDRSNHQPLLGQKNRRELATSSIKEATT
ncbi:cation channel complex component UNC80 domain-containing protein [Phthorimaea operculella]|nr:cation channel complex component UNC80 domain-containing protein [Phthorimaea operculella]